MTDNEKRRILELRDMGYGYQRIANELGITVGSVRNYCSKMGSRGLCKECGKELKLVPGKKKKVFCSDKCRFIWWNKHRGELKHKVMNKVTYKCCGTEFISFTNSKRTYCSVECYNKIRCKDGGSNE
jgi:predicted transcriptional regulator